MILSEKREKKEKGLKMKLSERSRRSYKEIWNTVEVRKDSEEKSTQELMERRQVS